MAKPDAGPWYTVARVVAVLAIVGVAGGVYAWYKAFRVVPQEICGDVEPSRRAELCADDAEAAARYGVATPFRHAEIDLVVQTAGGTA